MERTKKYEQTFTLTFGDVAENHVGMQKIGKMASNGFDLKDLECVKEWFEKKKKKCSLILLNNYLENETNLDLTDTDKSEIKENITTTTTTTTSSLPSSSSSSPPPLKKQRISNSKSRMIGDDKNIELQNKLEVKADKAYILIIKDGLNAILDPQNADDFYKEQNQLEKDTKSFMYGRVVNKQARYNLCFDSVGQEADYQKKKGRVVSFDDVPLLKKAKTVLESEILGEKGMDLRVEGNYYYDISKCGIGFHGDAERKKVIGIRVGATLPLHFQWFHQNVSMGHRAKFLIGHGDIYVMSEKATGFDWKRRNVYTLRHAAGSEKFLEVKSNKKHHNVVKLKKKKNVKSKK